jgi:hypothetical protein
VRGHGDRPDGLLITLNSASSHKFHLSEIFNRFQRHIYNSSIFNNEPKINRRSYPLASTMPLFKPEIPQEILDAIICELHGDPDALKACSVTSSAFSPASRKLLCAVVRLDSASIAQRFHHLISLHPELSSYVRDLCLIPEIYGTEPSWLKYNQTARTYLDSRLAWLGPDFYPGRISLISCS